MMQTNFFLVTQGVIAAAHAVAALVFLRFWRRTRDRLFAFFAVAFTLLSVQRLYSALAFDVREAHPGQYLLRLAAFLLIIVAIADKNRSPLR